MKLLPAFLFASLLLGQTGPATIRASGEATVSAQPDQAEVSIGVLTQAPRAADATAQNAATTARVLDALKGVIGTKGELKTIGYSLSPTYKYVNKSAPAIVGYQASNTVLVTLHDLSMIGKVLDSASSAGSNQIAGIQFMLRDDAAVRTRALAEAAKRARANGEAIAKALNMHVTGVVEAEATNLSPPRRFMPMASLSVMAAPTSTPIESEAAVDVQVSVTVTLAVHE
ncbi:MAG: SIMPL domain-containing protein [Bryobacteraceae bacterium]